ncbi:MAG TPA: ABC-ATPase UvrA, partial [Bdellovibrionales bacterium]|nr:ABC-ATPase UvrA [Bdellovibrionales bacterium]
MTQKTDLRDEEIAIRGAKVHNLKNISVTLPRNKLVVLTGVSGSGKSSLAFDTIYAEGQRRYVESLSAYARQFLEQLSKPDIESITGLSPTISIEQRTTSYNPRSTVGTVTEIYDYLRLLFARVSKPYCWKCEQPIRSQSPQQVVDSILSSPLGTRLSILAPIVRGRKGEYQKELLQLRQRGFVRVRVDGDIHDLSDDITLDKNKKHDISVYIDRLIIKGDLGTLAARISDSVELGLKLGEGMLILETQPSGATAESEPIETLLSEKFACPTCHISYPSPEPRTFSFNSPMGACPECDGLGTKPSPEDLDAEEDTVDSDLNLDAITGENAPCSSCNGARLRKESLHYRLAERNISNLTLLSISELSAFFNALVLTDREQLIANRILKEIKDRCGFLNEVGVGYLSL